jgi:putative CocE/NonD family hydrolase
MRDGTVLRADVYRPSEEGRYPVLVSRTPYNKQLMPLVTLDFDPIRAAEAGYVVVIQDVRARWASDGEGFFPYRDEFEDGHDTVEWAAAQEWSDGNVGCYGVSYLGGTTWHAAASAPDALRAIAPTTAPNHFGVQMGRPGVFQLGAWVGWALQAVAANQLVRTKGGTPDFVPALMGLVADLDGYDEIVRQMPLTEFAPAHPDDPSFLRFFFRAAEELNPSEFDLSRHEPRKQAAIRVPALITAGWYDLLLADDLANFTAMRESAATPEAREQTKLIIGPWSHGMFLQYVGELDFGMRANGLFLDLREDMTNLRLRWFDRWLKGSKTGVEDDPPVKLFVQGVNRWRNEDAWPLARARDEQWFMREGGGLAPSAPSSDERADSYVYDPEDPCPTRGGALLMPGTYARGPVNQLGIIGRKDVLTYTSEVLDRDTEVTGPVHAVLHASTSAPDTDWVVKLCDVHPDGRTFNVCDGITRARYRNGTDAPALVDPGTVERYEVDLWATSIVFKAGHRIRMLVTSSDFPRYDRNPNTGALGTEATSTTPALQRIFHDANRASHIVLPIVDA